MNRSCSPVLVILNDTTGHADTRFYLVPAEDLAAHPTLGSKPLQRLRIAHNCTVSATCPEEYSPDTQQAVKDVYSMATALLGWPREDEWTGLLHAPELPEGAPDPEQPVSAIFYVGRSA